MYRKEYEDYDNKTQRTLTEQLGNLQENLNIHKDNLSQSITLFEEKVNENQKETLWKIRDCEDLLKTRISEQKVQDMCEKLEQKVSFQVQTNDDKLHERVMKANGEIKSQFEQLKISTQSKHDSLKELCDFHEAELAKLTSAERFDDHCREVAQMKRDFEDEFEVLGRFLKDSKDKMAELTKKFNLAYDKLANGIPNVSHSRGLDEILVGGAAAGGARESLRLQKGESGSGPVRLDSGIYDSVKRTATVALGAGVADAISPGRKRSTMMSSPGLSRKGINEYLEAKIA